jgi:hypothetical protein
MDDSDLMTQNENPTVGRALKAAEALFGEVL